MRIFLIKASFFSVLLMSANLTAQTDTIVSGKDSVKKFTYTFIADAYFSYDFTQPKVHQKANFLYNYKRNREINFNFLYFKTAYSFNRTRVNFALHTGNYVQYNYESEPVFFQFVNEASVGYKIAKKRNLWIDAGIMPSHIGFESAINSDCSTLTRSVLAENSPYFETGIKLSYITTSEKWTFNLLGINGWQRIASQSTAFSPSAGMQITYVPNKKWLFNYSNFMGEIKSLLPFNRTYHNFYTQFKSDKNINITAGLDIGSDSRNNYHANWLAAVFIIQKNHTKNLKYAMRVEYLKDPNNTLIQFESEDKNRTILGCSANLDYWFRRNLVFRIEGKYFNTSSNVFNDSDKQQMSFTSNLTFILN